MQAASMFKALRQLPRGTNKLARRTDHRGTSCKTANGRMREMSAEHLCRTKQQHSLLGTKSSILYNAKLMILHFYPITQNMFTVLLLQQIELTGE